ncbi:MAG: hypothetical protein AB1758_19895, partial [Candidatus Eremiobacterota bacterium]
MTQTHRHSNNGASPAPGKSGVAAPDPEVKPKKATRRSFTAQYKLRILTAGEPLSERGLPGSAANLRGEKLLPAIGREPHRLQRSQPVEVQP